jgi:hypothetical protein
MADRKIKDKGFLKDPQSLGVMVGTENSNP